MPATAPYDLPRMGQRISNAQEADRGLQTMMLHKWPQTRLVVLDLVLAV